MYLPVSVEFFQIKFVFEYTVCGNRSTCINFVPLPWVFSPPFRVCCFTLCFRAALRWRRRFFRDATRRATLAYFGHWRRNMYRICLFWLGLSLRTGNFYCNIAVKGGGNIASFVVPDLRYAVCNVHQGSSTYNNKRSTNYAILTYWLFDLSWRHMKASSQARMELCNSASSGLAIKWPGYMI